MEFMQRSTSKTSEGHSAEGRATPLLSLAKHRRQRGLTQRQLGQLAGVAHTTVQQLESLKRGELTHTLYASLPLR
jgi:DNA-binding XRE family transcriptional regulator